MTRFSIRKNSKKRKSVRNRKLKGGKPCIKCKYCQSKIDCFNCEYPTNFGEGIKCTCQNPRCEMFQFQYNYKITDIL